MEKVKQNGMGSVPVRKLIWKLGLPMIASMVLQALYNVVDSVFVANMQGSGVLANEALTIAFPVQILIIAIGVGTGVGLNALLSKGLGKGAIDEVNAAAGNGIFLIGVIFLPFLIFGLFFSELFISLFTSDPEVLRMGTEYLRICTCFSLGSIGFTVYERFLQATGKTAFSTLAQISGAAVNIVLDYVFIFPLGLGVAGAAWATVIGQFVSLFMAMGLHYGLNREISGSLKYIKPSGRIIGKIYKTGVSAAIMQALLSVMMAGMNAILGTAAVDSAVLVGSFGIYYKIQQIALFSAFGLSNTIITILSYNYGAADKARSTDCIKNGIFASVVVSLIITVLFELFALPLSKLFALTEGSSSVLTEVCARATRLASIGFVFMGFNVAVQGVLQALGYAVRPLVTAFMRLILFVLPIAFLFTLTEKVVELVWLAFPLAEVLTSVFSFVFLKSAYNKKIKNL